VAGSLAIERFRITGLAPADHPAPDRLKAALERIDVNRLTRRIASALGDFGSDDERVIILRRLDIATPESRIDDADWLARQFADGVAAAVARLAGMAAAETIAIFPSAGARLASFIAAAVRGDAWGRWWFSDLDHLKMLPVSSAIRTVLLRDPAVGLDALRATAATDRVRIATSLSAIDAELLLEGLEPSLALEEDDEVWVQAFMLPPTPPAWPLPVAMVHDLASIASLSNEPLPRSLPMILRVRARLSRIADSKALPPTLIAGSAKALDVLVPDLDPAELASLLALPATVRTRIAQAVEETEKQAMAAPGYTPFGGILLLWPHLPEIHAEALPDGPGNPSGLLALLSLASLFGRSQAALAISDPVLRSAMGIDQRATQADLAAWLGRVPPAALPAPTLTSREAGLPRPFTTRRQHYRAVKSLGLAALADFARRLPGFAGASLPFLRANLIGVGARVWTGKDAVDAILDRPPLDVLLSISGLADRSVDLPDGRRLELERAG